ncbi:MAG: hypothetical protein IMZ64_00800 [Bacteroidetes bacterium]|nr:hypothetical protein [Bacteroidota bacterium]
MFEVEYKTLDATDTTNMFVSLDGTPITADNVALDTIGGTAQALDGDFAVDGTRIKWDSTVYNLYSQLTTGDKLRIIYDRS